VDKGPTVGGFSWHIGVGSGKLFSTDEKMGNIDVKEEVTGGELGWSRPVNLADTSVQQGST